MCFKTTPNVLFLTQKRGASQIGGAPLYYYSPKSTL